MKKALIIILCILLAAAAVTAIIIVVNKNRSAGQDDEIYFEGVVMDVLKGTDGYSSIFLYNKEGAGGNGELAYAALEDSTEITDKSNNRINLSEIMPGQLVKIVHSGIVQETYPPTYPQVFKVSVLGNADEALIEKAMQAEAAFNDMFKDDDADVPPEPQNGSSTQGDSIYLEPPADAAQYRGVVEKIENIDGETEIILSQAEGTNFGSQTLITRITPETRHMFELSTLKTGDYLEVWYGIPLEGEKEDIAYFPAIVANLLPEASISNFNGEITEITKDSETSGSILLTSLDSDYDVLFQYDENTKIYLNLDELEKGDKLNIYYSGVTTRSIPPQAFALEMRTYFEGY